LITKKIWNISVQIVKNKKGSETRGKLEEEVDALFKLPLAEFTGARNTLAAQLKRDGRANEANIVKALPKPSISAWAVNQLHWKHREAFAQLMATSQQLRQAQKSRTTGKIGDMRGSLDARREALSQLSELASALLSEAGHNPTPDTIHRITTTLQAVAAYTSPDGPTPGRLTHDIDPPGFESLASMIPGAKATKFVEALPRVATPQKLDRASTKTRQKGDAQKAQREVRRQERIAAARASLQEAKRALTGARSWSQRTEAAQKKLSAETKQAEAEVRQAEKEVREAERRFKKASAASEAVAQRAQRLAAEAEEAAQAVEDGERDVQEAAQELETLFEESATT
jgi:hypothetical protein